MSRAFVREDAGDDRPEMEFTLPSPDDPAYDAAAALAMLQAAAAGLTSLAEQATGYRWGDPQLAVEVRRLLDQEEEQPMERQDARFMTVARRYLREADEPAD